MTLPYKLLGNLDISETLKKVEQIDWKGLKITRPIMKSNKDPVEMVIVFSYPDKENICIPELILKQDLLDLFQQEINNIYKIIKTYYNNMEPKRIVLNKFLPHEVIPEHVDFTYHYEHTIRTHLPIVTNKRCIFGFPGCTIHMEAGTVYEFNNNIPHAAVNDSDEERIHLIIDWGDIDDPYWNT